LSHDPVLSLLGRRLRLGVVGGGGAAMVGPIHRRAARLDDRIELVAAALSADPAKGMAEATALGIPRPYPDLAAMLAAERGRVDGIDAVAIMTPNHLHGAQAEAALAAGLDVICDKPLTNDLAAARRLVRVARDAGRLLALTHNYSGYPLVREARARVAAGELGRLNLVEVAYLQGSLAALVEAEGPALPPRLAWRLDPARGGASHVMGDIGTHAHQLLTFVTGVEVEAVTAELGAVVPGRTAHDTGIALLRLAGGARGTLIASKAASGAGNSLRLAVYGERGGLRWRQDRPDELSLVRTGLPETILQRGLPGLSPQARRAARLPAMHPEGFHDAFAVLYADFALQVAARLTGTEPDPLALDLPTAATGARGLAFVEACLCSSETGRWVEVPAID
jgi:predicted dehydrogenase